MEHDVGIPGDRMLRKYPAHVAFRTRRAAPRNPFKGRSMTVDVGTGSRSVQVNVGRVQGVGEISPLDGMNRFLVAKVTLGAGDICSPPGKIIPVAIGAG